MNDDKMPIIHEPQPDDLVESALAELNPKQQRFAHLYLSGAHNLTEIAKLLNVSLACVRNWLAKPQVRDAIDRFQAEEDAIVKQGLKAMRMKAMYRMNALVDSKQDAIAWQAAKDILDRTGHKAVNKSEVNVEIKTFEQELKELADDIEYEAIDVDFEDVD